MTKKQFNAIAKFIDAANASWGDSRFIYRLDDDPVSPSMVLSSCTSDIFSLVSAIDCIFCGFCVVPVSDGYKFSFEIF